MESPSSAVPASAGKPKRLSPRGLFRTACDLAFASIGITGVLCEEAQSLYGRSVARGGSTVRKAKDRLKRASNPRRWHVSPRGKRRRRSQAMTAEVEAALARLNAPTAADIATLTQQVAELEAKIGQLSKQ